MEENLLSQTIRPSIRVLGTNLQAIAFQVTSWFSGCLTMLLNERLKYLKNN